MKARYILLLLIFAGFAVKIYPVLSHDFLVNFDSIYHSRIGQIVADTGWVPYDDPAAGGRPHLYPPGYHILLGYLSIITGVPVINLIGFVLPFVSSLLVLPTFFLVQKFRDTNTAIWASLFMAVNPVVASQSYDSPHLFGLLLFPLIAYFFLKGKYFPAGILFSICILFNYGISITIFAVLLIYSIVSYLKGKKRALIYSALIITIGLGLASPWLLVSLSRSGECLDVSTAVVSINESGQNYLWTMAPFLLVIGLLLLYSVKSKNDEYALFWRVCFTLGLVTFIISLFVSELHPYDQVLLLGFSFSFLLAEIKMRLKYKVAIIALLSITMIFSILAVVPPISHDDLSAVNWAVENANGTVLADLEVSATINLYSKSNSPQTVFDQFLECIPQRDRWIQMNNALLTSDKEKAQKALDKYGIEYIIVGDRDRNHFGFDIDKFKEMDLEPVVDFGNTVIYRNGKN